MQLKNKRSISVHRAFVYGACAPGLGEIYAGGRLRGGLTASLFILSGVWFTWTLVKIVGSMVGRVFDSLNGISPSMAQDLPLLSLGISFLGIYGIWLWALISSVDVAIEGQRKNAEPPQTSIAWAVAISWFCPGAGQVYTASRRFGYILFVGYIMGILLMVPAYMQLFQSMSALVKNGQLSPSNPHALIDMIQGLLTKVDYSFGKLFQSFVKYFALAATVAAVRQRTLEYDIKWSRPSLGYGATLFGIGWLCPGAGQLLQKRHRTGWCILAAYIGSKIIIGFLLGHSFITVQRADTLAWISLIIQWGAMLEALLWMVKANWHK
jgi:hypothetical protein